MTGGCIKKVCTRRFMPCIHNSNRKCTSSSTMLRVHCRQTRSSAGVLGIVCLLLSISRNLPSVWPGSLYILLYIIVQTIFLSQVPPAQRSEKPCLTDSLLGLSHVGGPCETKMSPNSPTPTFLFLPVRIILDHVCTQISGVLPFPHPLLRTSVILCLFLELKISR